MARIAGNPCGNLLLAVALPFDAHDGAVVHQPVRCGVGHGPAREDLVPIPEGLVGGHQQGAPLVAMANQLVVEAFSEGVQDRGLQLAAPHLGDVCDHKHAVAIELLKDGRQLVAGLVRS